MAAVVDFRTAAHCLERIFPPAFDAAADRLRAAGKAFTVLAVLKNRYPALLEGFLQEAGATKISLADVIAERKDDEETLWQKLLGDFFSSLERDIPINSDWMYELAAEGEPLVIQPDQLGFGWNDDEMSEVFDDPSNLPESADLAMFFKTLWIGTAHCHPEGARALWESMREHFDFPCEFPSGPDSFDAARFWEHLRRELVEAGLDEFWNAMNVALCDTGNLFLDGDPNEYGYCDPIELSLENIEKLIEEKNEAMQLLDLYEACREKAREDPGIYGRLAQIWSEALAAAAQPAPRVPGKPLIEVFDEEDECDGDDQEDGQDDQEGMEEEIEYQPVL